jgi:hypothetical protein
MAGERKGITYEAIVKVALQELIQKGKLTGQVFWNEKPVTIEPDFTVGRDKDHPAHVFLVTHSGSAKESEKKFWRNIGELAEVKVRLPKSARVYSIVFDGVVKEDLKLLQAAAFDGHLAVGDCDYGLPLQRWVDTNLPRLPKGGREKVDAIRDVMKNEASRNNPRPLIAEFVRDLEKLIQIRRAELDALWVMERKRPMGRVPGARETFLRQGLGKLALFRSLDGLSKSGVIPVGIDHRLIESLKLCGIVRDSIQINQRSGYQAIGTECRP